MCPKDKPQPQKTPLPLDKLRAQIYRGLPTREDSRLETPSGNGLTDSPGPTGPPSPSEPDAENGVDSITSTPPVGATLVRHHSGLSDLSVSFFHLTQERPGTFIAWKLDDLDAYTVMLSCDMTSSSYAALISTLERTRSDGGRPVTVELAFKPTTANLVRRTTAPST